MDTKQKEYYNKMLKKGRLVHFHDGSILKCFITFYIGNDDNKYIRENPWELLNDEPDMGQVCYVDQCISDKNVDNPFEIWNTFKKIVIDKFPQIKEFKWNRFKNGEVNRYNYKLKGEEMSCIQ